METMKTYKRGKSWYIRFTDHRGHRRAMSAATDKRVAENVARKVAGLVSAARAGESLPDDLVEWVFRLDDKRRGQLVAWCLVSEKHLRSCDTLESQIDMWIAGLEARGRYKRKDDSGG